MVGSPLVRRLNGVENGCCDLRARTPQAHLGNRGFLRPQFIWGPRARVRAQTGLLESLGWKKYRIAVHLQGERSQTAVGLSGILEKGSRLG